MEAQRPTTSPTSSDRQMGNEHQVTTAIADRRSRVRRDKQKRIFRCAWKFCLSAGLLAGTVYLAYLPNWHASSDSIDIQGNEVLSDAELRPIIPISESSYIWQVEPALLEAALLRHPLLRHVTVNRHLFPPHIEARVDERQPAALATWEGIEGFLDTEGIWVPNAYLSGRTPSSSWPSLRVEGLDTHSSAEWAEMLAALQQSPVRIESLDWTSTQNAILETELGQVHLGPTYSSHTPAGITGTSPLAEKVLEQLGVLDGMRRIYERPNCSYCDQDKIDYIDLTRPNAPTLELTEEAMAEYNAQRNAIEDFN